MGTRLRRSASRPFWAPLAVAAVWLLLFLVAGCASTRTLSRDPGPGSVWRRARVVVTGGIGGVALAVEVPRDIESDLPQYDSLTARAARSQALTTGPALR